MKTVPDGVYPTMVTPFAEDLQVDRGALPPLLRWYEERGVTGVFAICQSSEIFHLSFEERLQILREIMRARSPGTVVLASGHTAYDPATQIREAKAFIEEGIDAYVFISNRFAAKEEGEDAFLRRIERVAKALPDLPLGIYECPYPYKRLLPPETIRRLGDVANFAFLKDTCCDLGQLKAKLEAAKRTGLKIFNANAAMLLESLRLGCTGYSGVMANLHPQLYVKLCACWQEDPALAGRLQAFLGQASLAESQMYPVNAKYTIALDGVPITWRCRAADATRFRRCDEMQIEQLRALAMEIEASYQK
ncbi:MAG: dihydrodipicolinate synthase family protein [Oscillospiraceae bacterium]|jgi:4-hydroxy-tetrahydrodipicolinate synthase|nr:dihydrodipicolinate synthase family protein [Oscillospiraceae bacterium]